MPAQAGKLDLETHVSSHSYRGSGLREQAKSPVGVWQITECEPLTTEPGCFGRGQGLWDQSWSTSLPWSLVCPALPQLERACKVTPVRAVDTRWCYVPTSPAHHQIGLVSGTMSVPCSPHTSAPWCSPEPIRQQPSSWSSHLSRPFSNLSPNSTNPHTLLQVWLHIIVVGFHLWPQFTVCWT